MYRFGKVDTDFFQGRNLKYHGFQTYANSKLASLLFTLELSEKLEHDGIMVNSVDPGIVDTNMLTMHKWFDPLTDIFFRPFIKTEDQGAKTSIYLATDSRLIDVTGKYFINSIERQIPKWVIQHPYRKALWQETESVLQL
jgi:NAD(P)-dependent dehydrogenase (short-subunit alcohol dehydrogenase family)